MSNVVELKQKNKFPTISDIMDDITIPLTQSLISELVRRGYSTEERYAKYISFGVECIRAGIAAQHGLAHPVCEFIDKFLEETCVKR